MSASQSTSAPLVPESLMTLLTTTLSGLSYSVPMAFTQNVFFIIHVLHENGTSGVHQDCVLAPMLFNLYFDVAIHMLLEMTNCRAEV